MTVSFVLMKWATFVIVLASDLVVRGVFVLGQKNC